MIIIIYKLKIILIKLYLKNFFYLLIIILIFKFLSLILLLLNKCSFLINDNKVNKEKGIFKLNINTINI